MHLHVCHQCFCGRAAPSCFIYSLESTCLCGCVLSFLSKKNWWALLQLNKRFKDLDPRKHNEVILYLHSWLSSSIYLQNTSIITEPFPQRALNHRSRDQHQHQACGLFSAEVMVDFLCTARTSRRNVLLCCKCFAHLARVVVVRLLHLQSKK